MRVLQLHQQGTEICAMLLVHLGCRRPTDRRGTRRHVTHVGASRAQAFSEIPLKYLAFGGWGRGSSRLPQFEAWQRRWVFFPALHGKPQSQSTMRKERDMAHMSCQPAWLRSFCRFKLLTFRSLWSFVTSGGFQSFQGEVLSGS